MLTQKPHQFQFEKWVASMKPTVPGLNYRQGQIHR